METKNQKKIAEIKEALRATPDLTEDSYGNFKVEIAGTHYRYHFSKNALRAEINISSSWCRRWSAYYKDISITEKGKLSVSKKIK